MSPAPKAAYYGKLRLTSNAERGRKISLTHIQVETTILKNIALLIDSAYKPCSVCIKPTGFFHNECKSVSLQRTRIHQFISMLFIIH